MGLSPCLKGGDRISQRELKVKRYNHLKSRARAMAYRLDERLRSWEGISSWYRWNSLEVWIRQQRKIESSMVISPFENNLSNIQMYSHEVIRWKILENPEMVELPSNNLYVLDEPVCRTRNGRVVICAPDLII